MSTAPLISYLLDAAIILLLILGIWLFRSPRRARLGNFSAVGALGGALLLVLWRSGVLDPGIVLAAMMIGGLLGYLVAVRVTMIQMPAMVAFQHGAGGIAAFLISYVELTRMSVGLSAFAKLSGILGLALGAATFSASMLASAKLSGKLKPAPTVLPAHTVLLVALAGLIVGLGVVAWNAPLPYIPYLIMIILAVVTGVVFAMRIGGADMPVLISFLNAAAGFAAAFCGSVINSRLLVACGATVAASGSVLTIVMCRAMNRGLGNIFLGTRMWRGPISQTPAKVVETTAQPMTVPIDPLERAAAVLQAASSVIIIPGYGMAQAQAQADVASLVRRLEGQGKRVRFAIHPVAGRMPGHMNVLLAEVDIAYDKLIEMEDINDDFKDTDLAVVVGACDVVNPAATEREDTPISGMPILKAHEAGHVIVCNLDAKPGYSGVPNTLYDQDKTILLFGDARTRLQELLHATGTKPSTVAESTWASSSGPLERAHAALQQATSVIIIPGFGMAMAQAQGNVASLAQRLEGLGKRVRFAIHPVAGRMPGHMNVLLAEVDIPYDKLIEMDLINADFKNTDVAMVVGACDVVNPAATEQEGTPISGMPILKANEAGHVIVCNLNAKPGYSGVPNTLYDQAKTILLFGDARERLQELLQGMS